VSAFLAVHPLHTHYLLFTHSHSPAPLDALGGRLRARAVVKDAASREFGRYCVVCWVGKRALRERLGRSLKYAVEYQVCSAADELCCTVLCRVSDT
jgi:hypothetical protein